MQSWISTLFKRGLCITLFLLSQHVSAMAAERSIAFYYANHIPVDELSMFDMVVVEDKYLAVDGMKKLKDSASDLFAYISVGEIRRDRTWFLDTKTAWAVGENSAWNSVVMDLANEQWHTFIINKLIRPLVLQGYTGVFLDTLDSYFLVAETVEERHRQQQGLVHFIQRLHQEYPELKILLNRGFEIIPEVHPWVKGVVAESLFQTWNPVSRVYAAVTENDHAWLKQKLQSIQQSYHLPIYIIDYVESKQRDLARETAKKISALGFIPWVSTPALNSLGVGSLEIVPRKIMILYDSQESELPYSQAHRYLSTPLEYMGYSLDYHDVHQGMPDKALAGEYAGIVGWFTDEAVNGPQQMMLWLLRQVDDGVPVVFLQSFGMQPTKQFLRHLGLAAVPGKLKRPLRITYKDKLAEMEVPPRALARNLFAIKAVSPDITVHERIQDARAMSVDVVITAPWGGLALSPYVLEEGIGESVSWRLDIFKFLKKALRLEPMPIFDVTTENGSRLLMTHIDGDGIASRADMPHAPLAIRVVRDEILRKYPLPATVSIIVSEIEDGGLFPRRASEMQSVARSIFALPHVEIASHSYSHPFNWGSAVQHDATAYLKIPGYVFSLEKEIGESIRYINKHLAPIDKKVKVFLWTGDALPDAQALQLVAAAGLKNINGGNTTIHRAQPSLTNVSSMARRVGDQLQIYAPVMNENLYTENWTKPRYGFERVVETFKMTDSPRRLKPIDIYYHFYSGSEFASLIALKRVYDWSMQQATLPIWVSEYVEKVEAYQHAVVAKDQDGVWLLQAADALRTVRLPPQIGWPNMKESHGVAGLYDLKQGRYIHLTGRKGYRLELQQRQPRGAYLVQANAQIEQWQVEGKRIRIRLVGHMPVKFTMNKRCELSLGKKKIYPKRQHNGYSFSLKTKDTGYGLLTCR